MTSYTYSYLITDLIFLAIWLTLFIWRKDVRRKILFLSIAFGVIGLIVEPIHILDWWKPITITNTPVGIEDFLYGFCMGGIAGVIYEEIFKKRIRVRKEKQKNILSGNFKLLIFILSFLLAFVIMFYIFRINTFISAITLLSLGTIIMCSIRPDFIPDSLFSGILILIIGFIAYSITNLITPGWVNAFWYFRNVPHIIFLNVPIDDIVWLFLTGTFIGPLYEFWVHGKLVNKK